jgi:hypothetical protein
MKIDKRMKRIFIVSIEITNACWDYKVGEVIRVPVVSNNHWNAQMTFLNHCSGGEYPGYKFVEIQDTINLGLFSII